MGVPDLGFDMSYAAGTWVIICSTNVFVNPDAYRVFMPPAVGGPDRAGDRDPWHRRPRSINQSGHYQGAKVAGTQRSTSRIRHAFPENGRSSNSKTAAPSRVLPYPVRCLLFLSRRTWCRGYDVLECSSIRYCAVAAAKAPSGGSSTLEYPDCYKCRARSAAPLRPAAACSNPDASLINLGSL